MYYAWFSIRRKFGIGLNVDFGKKGELVFFRVFIFDGGVALAII